ncbi:ATP-binding protein [Aestuariibacter sp. AA17]|uniref:histidine kinase n=1 Tax=Fluctibacter corallii TaxID=2984329 RepID=A0ABT3A6E3_9ALTE|nr:ATP-binding protein [Aestuariibacter sp. AA17]MCV2883852.1 ATP-binding protein [Aestuariibacter sp. AA17]
MKTVSLRLRGVIAALIAITVFVPLSIIALESAFTNSLRQSLLEQLRVHSLTLIAEFEMDKGQAQMPEALLNNRLNMPESGLYAYITSKDTLLWSSLSTLNQPPLPNILKPETGKELFIPKYQTNNAVFLYAYTAEFEGANGYQPVSFLLLQSREQFEQEREAFSSTLRYWIGGIGAILLIILLYTMNMMLRPIKDLAKQIKQTEYGEQTRVSEDYPPELEILKSSINHLLDVEQAQRTRYKNSLGDLAHSLKTPLAVVNNIDGLPDSAREPLAQISAIIERQLKRAVAGTGSGWENPIEVKPIVTKLLNAMSKVYHDKNVKLENNVDEKAQFKGDETDLMEMLGNVIDNACKAAKASVKVNTVITQHYLSIIIEDDGNGISPTDRAKLIERGKRLDSYQEGQGIGMAVVADLVAAYQGKIDINESTLGGAKLSLFFPHVLNN